MLLMSAMVLQEVDDVGSLEGLWQVVACIHSHGFMTAAGCYISAS